MGDDRNRPYRCMGRHRGRYMAISLIALALLGGCIPQMGAPERDYPAPPPYQAQRPYDQRQPYQPRAEDDRRYPPAAPPAWLARPVSPDAQTIRASTYVVQPGDTLRGIADRTGSGSEAIARANGLRPPFTVQSGQRLTIPAGRYHLVRAGQTGIAIARAYRVDWSRIIAANDLAAPYTLRVGMRILIPGGPVTAAERAATFRLDIDDILTGGEPALAVNQRPARPSVSPTRTLPPNAALAEPARLRGAFAWPARGNIVARFGPGATGEKFNGINIAVPLDTPVLASADGVVAYAGNELKGYGNLILVRHANGYVTAYAHASELLVKRGETIKRGQVIAKSGQSGEVGSPQLHFEIRKGSTPVDPLQFLNGA